MRFIHAADLHLAKPFGRFDADTQAALRTARLDALRRLGDAARAGKAEFILIAGDTFDAEAPPSKVVRRALDLMGEFSDLQWVLLPGNHDSLAAVDLWERMERDKPDNVVLALTPDVIELGDQVAILPAPPAVRNPFSRVINIQFILYHKHKYKSTFIKCRKSANSLILLTY